MTSSLTHVVFIAAVLCLTGSALAEATERFDKQTLFKNDHAMGYHTVRIPVLLWTDQGTLLAFAEGRVNSYRDYGDIDLIVRRSTDRGDSWSDVQIVHREEGDITIGNPVAMMDRQKGKIVLLFTRNNRDVFVTESKDDGVSWAKPQKITEQFRDCDWPEWRRVATGPVHGIQLESGRLVAPIWLNRNYGGERMYRAATAYSDDHGKTWKISNTLTLENGYPNECAVAELADGSLYLNMRARGATFRAVARSTDGGATWSDAKLDRDLPGAVCQGALLTMTDEAGQPILLLSHNPTPHRQHLAVLLSRDGGETWPTVRQVAPGRSAYSDMAHDDQGTIYLLYETGGNSPYERIDLVRFNLPWLRAGEGK